MSANDFGAKMNNLTKLFHLTCRETGVNYNNSHVNAQNLVIFGPVTTKFSCLTFTRQKSTLRI